MNLLLRNVLPENLPRVSLRCTDRGYTLTEADETLIAILFERFHVSSRNPDKQEFSRLILVLSETQTQLSLSDARKLDGFRLTLPPFPSILEMVSVNNLEGLTFDLYTDNTHLPTSKQHQLPPSDKWREFFQRHLTVTKSDLAYTRSWSYGGPHTVDDHSSRLPFAKTCSFVPRALSSG